MGFGKLHDLKIEVEKLQREVHEVYHHMHTADACLLDMCMSAEEDAFRGDAGTSFDIAQDSLRKAMKLLKEISNA